MSYARRSIAVVVPLLMAPLVAAVGQSSVAISPFVSYIPSAERNPLAGLALTFGGTTGLALRGSAALSLSNPDSNASGNGGYRPWSADADALLFLGGLGGGATVFSRALAPYLFSGIGLAGGDSSGVNVVHNGWSYGAGATIPLGLDADVFAEARWRMTEYVLPTAKDAPDSRSELRFGLSFHVGGSSSPARERSRRGRYGYDEDDADEQVVQQAAPAPPPQTIIVQQPQPQTVVVQQPAPVIVQQQEPQTIIVREQEPRQTVIVRQRTRPTVVIQPNIVVVRRSSNGQRYCVDRSVRVHGRRVMFPC
jgi:hypothetical protein